MNKVLAIAPHPDDETLGCGGTLLRHRDNGDEVYWLIITNILEVGGYKLEEVNKRQDEIDKVFKLYQFAKKYQLDFPTTELDQLPMGMLIRKISEIMDLVKPEILYIPFHSDIHSDHQVTFKAVMSCAKNFRCPFIKRILMYETLSETEFAPALQDNIFLPNVFIDTSKYIHKKLEIMQVYESELMSPPNPRSIKSIEILTKYRGSRIGCEYAEAFSLLYEKWNG